jgi:hypothetical protein
MGMEGCHNYQPTFINDLSDYDMDVQRQSCATLKHAFPTLVSHSNVMFIDECAALFQRKVLKCLYLGEQSHIFLKK